MEEEWYRLACDLLGLHASEDTCWPRPEPRPPRSHHKSGSRKENRRKHLQMQTFRRVQKICLAIKGTFCVWPSTQMLLTLTDVLGASTPPSLPLKLYLERGNVLETHHFQHVRGSRLNGSPEGVVHVHDLGLNGCVFCTNTCPRRCEHMHAHARTHNLYLNPVSKQQIKRLQHNIQWYWLWGLNNHRVTTRKTKISIIILIILKCPQRRDVVFDL